ncbi:MAG: hypothetical protein F4X74_08465, partial [Acidimicrobiia bacterium]|nr:hypothetical protein [Acidimicrobiia bacterium]
PPAPPFPLRRVGAEMAISARAAGAGGGGAGTGDEGGGGGGAGAGDEGGGDVGAGGGGVSPRISARTCSTGMPSALAFASAERRSR